MTRFFRLGILVAVLAAYPAGLLLSQESGQSVHLSFAEQYRTYDSEHPGVPIGPGYSIQQRSLGKATTGLTREVFGYLPYWFRDRWNLLDYGLVSTIAYFSGEAASDGTIGNTHGWPTYPGDPTAHASVINMINRAHANGVRVVLCITNFDGNAIHSIVTNPAYSATLIEQAFALVQAGNADGVNINFEAILSASRDPLTAFMKALADTFHVRMPGSQVSCAPTDFDTRSGDWDIAALNPFVDLFFFQGYGYGYGGSSTTRPVGLLPNTSFWGSLNITTFMNFVLARIPPTKAVLGVPHYGYRWPAVSGDPKAQTLGAGIAFYYPDALGYIASYGRQWDALALNPWYRYQAAGQWYQGWYDDPESMSYKYQFVLDRSLMGVGMWSLGMDGSNHDIWDVLASYFGDSTVASRPPRQPVLSSVCDTSDSEGRVVVRWSATDEPVLGGFRLYMASGTSAGPFDLVLNETALGRSDRSATISGLVADSTYYVRLLAVDTSRTRISDTSDTYGIRLGRARRYLVVDGFDRTTGSYPLPYHAFNAYYTGPIVIAGRSCDAADNDAVIAGEVGLSDYAGVIWFLGDESVADRTFNQTEQQLISAYLEAGGNLFVSGSEVGFDLGRAASANYNPVWYNGYLKASYVGDNSGTQTFSGTTGSIFQGLSGQFGQTYPEDYPDYINVAGGSAIALNYNSTRFAAVQYAGAFGASSVPGHLVNMGFAFETIASPATRTSLMTRILDFFEGTSGAGDGRELPADVILEQNYPNPFNPGTDIGVLLPSAGKIRLAVFDVLGREVAVLMDGVLEAGRHVFHFDGAAYAGGTYFCRLEMGRGAQTRKMLLLK